MKYNPQCMTDVINYIITNLEFANKEPNGTFDIIPMDISTIYSDIELQKKYDALEIKLCLCILKNQKLFDIQGQSLNNKWKINSILEKGYETLFKIPLI